MDWETSKEWLRERLDLEKLGFTKAQLVAISFLVVLILLGAGILYFRNNRPQKVEKVTEPLKEVSPNRKNEESATLIVHVAGAVKKPDVYELEEGKRVIDAIEKAGGLNPKADSDALNLAAKVRDGQKIYVPKEGEKGNSPNSLGLESESSTENTPLDLNAASSQQLEELPGIGPTLAQRIIDYRSQHSSFRSVEELQQVEGIGPKKYSQIKNKVVVN